MKIAFSTTCTSGYVQYMRVLIKSVLFNNPDFDYDYLIWTDGSISLADMNYFKSLYDKIHFIKIDKGKYAGYKKGVKCFSMECFFPRGYDKIIYNGADMLCKKSVKEIVDFDTDGKLGLQIENRRYGSYNNGCMIVPKELMTVDNYNGLMNNNYENSPIFGTDQKIIQLFFKKDIIKTPLEFNTLISELEFSKWDDIIFLHYIYKPNRDDFLSRSSQKLLDLWQSYEKMEVNECRPKK